MGILFVFNLIGCFATDWIMFAVGRFFIGNSLPPYFFIITIGNASITYIKTMTGSNSVQIKFNSITFITHNNNTILKVNCINTRIQSDNLLHQTEYYDISMVVSWNFTFTLLVYSFLLQFSYTT